MNRSRPSRRRSRRLALLAAVATLTVALAPPVLAAPVPTDADALRDLAAVRAATAKYHDVEAALADGYVSTEECVEVPGLGAMGVHYVNFGLVVAPGARLTAPELLLYVNTASGPRLVGVEYITIDADQDPATDGDRPVLFGRGFDGPMPAHGPGQPVHYDLHVWTWQANSVDVFAPFNPALGC